MYERYLSLFDEHLRELLSVEEPNNLNEAMSYSLFLGGKRYRPLLFMLVLEALGHDYTKMLDVPAAIEMIHTYSLIHDDLPAMDDDDYRRGQLSNHKVFGEALAILSGDALLTDAFGVVLKSPLSAEQKLLIVQEMVHASGSEGMVYGQVLDLLAEGMKVSLSDLKKIHTLKTARLLQLSIVSAIITAGRENLLEKGRQLGLHLGIAFQIQDDLLDVLGDFKTLGKTVGSDETNDKSTYVKLLGVEGCRRELKKHFETCMKLVEEMGMHEHVPLMTLIEYAVSRKK